MALDHLMPRVNSTPYGPYVCGATSLSDLATGPQYTFNKDYRTVVDYRLLDTSAAHLLQKCATV